MTPEKLIKAGYKEFKVPKIKSAQRAFQKRFIEGESTKYFITIYYYNHSYVGVKDVSYQVDLQFYKMFRDKEITLDVTLFGLFDYIEESKSKEFFDIDFIEDYVEEFFKLNKFKYYEKN